MISITPIAIYTARGNLKAMQINEGKTDRISRVVLGLAILSLVFVGPKSLVGLIGLIPLLTGLVGICPLYKALGISTCPVKRA